MKTIASLILLLACLVTASAQVMVRVDGTGNAVSSPLPGIGYTNIGTSALTLFSTNASRSAGRVIFREVRNMGTVPIMYAVNNTNVATNSLHGVIAAGTAIRDGLGGKVDFTAVPYPITFRTATGNADIAILEVTQ